MKTTSRSSNPATGGDGVKIEEGHVSVSEDEADCKDSGDKIFRQLGFPEIESAKFNPADFSKVAKCLTKRSTKLQEMVTSLKAVEKPSGQQQTFLGTNDKLLIHCCFHFPFRSFGSGKNCVPRIEADDEIGGFHWKADRHWGHHHEHLYHRHREWFQERAPNLEMQC